MTTLRVLLVIFTITSYPVSAETFLCLPESGASIVQSYEGRLLDSSLMKFKDEKWLVDRNGIREFGSDKVLMSRCRFPETGAIYCDKGEFSTHHFLLNGTRVFSMTGIGSGDQDNTMFHFIIVGKCSKLVESTTQ